MSDEDTDPVEEIDEIHYALRGEIDDATRRTARRIEDEGPSGPTAERVAAHRHLKDVLSRIEASRTPPELKQWLMRAVAERRPAPAEIDVSWISALPMAAPMGLRSRGPSTERMFACAFDGGELRAHVQFAERGAACAVTGRLIGPDRNGLAARPVALFVDRGPREATVTDERGEFSFDARRGAAFGVRVGAGPEAVHVALIERPPARDDLEDDPRDEHGPTR